MLIFLPQITQAPLQLTFHPHLDLNHLNLNNLNNQTTPMFIQHQMQWQKRTIQTNSQAHWKQTPAIVGQLDNILVTKELSLENNEDMEEKLKMETIMKDIQVQPWWQHEDDITMFSEMAVKDAMNKVLSQLKIDSRN
eukprot:3920177-Amphidinium_carterae.3